MKTKKRETSQRKENVGGNKDMAGEGKVEEVREEDKRKRTEKSGIKRESNRKVS